MSLRTFSRFKWIGAAVIIAILVGHYAIASERFASRNGLNERQNDARQDPQEILLTLNSGGFDPVEVRPQSGRFLLSLDNRSGTSELVLQLSRADGTQIRELRVSGGGGDWSEAFDLAAGTYYLRETNHSAWSCTIIVQQS